MIHIRKTLIALLLLCSATFAQRIQDRTQAEIDAGTIGTVQARIIRNSTTGDYYVEEPDGGGGSQYVQVTGAPGGAEAEGTVTRVSDNGTITTYVPTPATDQGNFAAARTALAAAVDGDTIIVDPKAVYEYDGVQLTLTGVNDVTVTKITATRDPADSYNMIFQVDACTDCTVSIDFDGKAGITYPTTQPYDVNSITFTNPNVSSDSDVVNLNNCNRCTLQDSTIKQHAGNVVIDSEGFPVMASIYGCSVTNGSDNRVLRSRFLYCGASGVSVGPPSTIVKDCYFDMCGQHACRYYGNEHFVLDSCVFDASLARLEGFRGSFNCNPSSGVAESVTMRNCTFRQPHAWYPDLVAYDAGETITLPTTDKYRYENNDIYERLTTGAGNIPGPGASNADWKYLQAYTSTWPMKFGDVKKVYLDGCRIVHAKNGNYIQHRGSLKLEDRVDELHIRNSFLSGQLTGTSALTNPVDIFIYNSTINAEVEGVYGSRIERVGSIHVEDSEINYDRRAWEAFSEGFTRSFKSVNTRYKPWKVNYTDSEIVKTANIEGIVNHVYFDRSNRIVDRATGTEYEAGWDDHKVADTVSARLWMSGTETTKQYDQSLGGNLTHPTTSGPILNVDPAYDTTKVRIESVTWTPPGGIAEYAFDGADWIGRDDGTIYTTYANVGNITGIVDGQQVAITDRDPTTVFIYDSSDTSTDNGGTIIEIGAGALTRQYTGPVKPEWWGAVKDGATDDSTAIQAAIDFCNAAGGGKVELSAGTYAVASTVSVLGDASLVGMGRRASALQWTGTTSSRTATFDATGGASEDLWSATAHGLSDGDEVRLSNSGGALPAGYDENTPYFVIDSSADTFRLSLISGGSVHDGTDDGSGTHTITEGGTVVRIGGDGVSSTRHSEVGAFEIDGDDKATTGIMVGDGNAASFKSVGSIVRDMYVRDCLREGVLLSASQINELQRIEMLGNQTGLLCARTGDAEAGTNTTTAFRQCRAYLNDGVGFAIHQSASLAFYDCVAESNGEEGLIFSNEDGSTWDQTNSWGWHLENNNTSRGAGTYGQVLIKQGSGGAYIKRTTFYGIRCGSTIAGQHNIVVERGNVTIHDPDFPNATVADIYCSVDTGTAKVFVYTDATTIDSNFIDFVGNSPFAIVKQRYSTASFTERTYLNAGGTITLVSEIVNTGIDYHENDILGLGRTIATWRDHTTNDTTPSVSNCTNVLINNASPTTISNFDFGSDGQIINVVIRDSNTGIADNSNIELYGTSYSATAGGAAFTFIKDDTQWVCISRTDI